MERNIANLTFDINPQAMAVGQFLAGMIPDFADYDDVLHRYQVEFETKPWYNGRERGIVITMRPNWPMGPCLHIAFFEHRNTDSICTLKWETDSGYWNHPLEDREIFEKAYQSGDKYDVAASFEYGSVGECSQWIFNEFRKFYNEKRKRREYYPATTEAKVNDLKFLGQIESTQEKE